MKPSLGINLYQGVLATVRYEVARSISLGRFAGFAVLGFFPAAITLIVCLADGVPSTILPISITCMVICVLANLLWSTSAVSSELEGKTWSYVSARPGGRISMMIGKYLVSVGWTWLVTTFALSVAIGVQALLQPTDEEVKYWLVLEGLGTLACFAYAAIFTLLGTIFHSRAMVAALIYTGVFELVIGSISANIMHLTIRAPLVHIGAYLLMEPELIERLRAQAILSDPNYFFCLLSIFLLTSFAFSASLFVARFREYLTTQET